MNPPLVLISKRLFEEVLIAVEVHFSYYSRFFVRSLLGWVAEIYLPYNTYRLECCD